MYISSARVLYSKIPLLSLDSCAHHFCTEIYPYDKLYLESHVQTLQLEQQQQLDQVTMVANADKINLVTSNYSHNINNNNTHDALDAQLPLMEQLNQNNENMTINYNNNNVNDNANANANANFVTHFATICNNNNHAITTTTTTTTNTNCTAHCALLDLSKFRWLRASCCSCVYCFIYSFLSLCNSNYFSSVLVTFRCQTLSTPKHPTTALVNSVI